MLTGITGVTNEVGAFVWGEAVDETAACFPERIDCSDGASPQQRLQFSEGLFNRVQIWTVRRDEQQARTGGLDRLTHPSDLVCAEVIHADDITAAQCRHQDLLDPGKKQFTVDGTVDYAGRSEAIAAQGADEGRGLPVTVGHGVNQPLATWRSPIATGHVRLRRGQSMKTSLVGIKPGCFSRHSARFAATSGRSCSAARRDFMGWPAPHHPVQACAGIRGEDQ